MRGTAAAHQTQETDMAENAVPATPAETSVAGQVDSRQRPDVLPRLASAGERPPKGRQPLFRR